MIAWFSAPDARPPQRMGIESCSGKAGYGTS